VRRTVQLYRRGRLVTLTGAEARMTLLDWLRLTERAVGTKEGCAEGDCGACTVVLARARAGTIVHDPVNACILLAGQADGAEVVTVEDIAAPDGPLHPVQDAMWRHHGSQCGFCTPGIVMSLYALQHQGTTEVSRQTVCDQLAGNLCRCTGYRPIVEAAIEACAAPPVERAARASLGDLSQLASADDVLAGDEAAFFAAPRTESALAALLAQHPDALVVAGATDAGLWVTKQLMEPRRVIWLGRVDGLDCIELAGGELRIGATASVANAARALGDLAPDLAEVVRRFGSAQVRASATVGGNIANGSPIGDLAPCLIALGATLELGHGATTRTIALEDFFLAYRKQDRRPGEIVRRVIVPLPQAGTDFRAYKISKRFDEDISAVLGAFSFRIEAGSIASARLAFGGMSGTPARARITEAKLAGAVLADARSWQPALETLANEFTPLSDHRASAAYRRLVARNILEKALMEIAGAPLSQTRILADVEVRDAAE